MRSVLTLAALGLAASVGVSASKSCTNTGRTSWTAKTTSTAGHGVSTSSLASTGSVGTVSSSTGSVETASLSTGSVESTSLLTGSETASLSTGSFGTASSSATSSQTGTPEVVNEITNGNFAIYNPSAPGGLVGFNVGGNAHQVSGFGYTGDGAQENGCAGLSSPGSDGLGKRDFGYDAMVEQHVQNLNPATLYTVHFYYSVVSSSFANACRMEVYFAGMFFGATDHFPSVQGVMGNTPWGSFGFVSSIGSSSGFISFALVCGGGGSASILLDQVFLSNNVSPGYFPSVPMVYPTTSTTGVSSVSTSASVSGSNAQSGTQSNTQTGSQAQTGSQTSTGTLSNTQTGSQTQTGSSNTQSISQTGTLSSQTGTLSGQATTDTRPPPTTAPFPSTAPFTATSPTIIQTSVTQTEGYCPPGIYAPGACFGATPTAQGSICTKRGFIAQSVRTWSIPDTVNPAQNSIHECAFLCKLDSQCVAFALDVFHVGCIFADQSVSESGFYQDASSTLYWSDMGCETCFVCDGETSPGPGSPTSTATASGQPGSNSLTLTNSNTGSAASLATNTPTTTPTASPTTSPSGPCSCSVRNIIGGPIICRKDGYVQEEAYAVSKTQYPGQSSPERCAAICWSIWGCKASAYDAVSKQCVFINDGLQAAGFSAGTSAYSYNWADIACWDCLTCTPSTDTATFSPGGNTPTPDPQTSSIVPSQTTTETAPATQPSAPNCECLTNQVFNMRLKCGKFATIERTPILVPWEVFGHQPTAGECGALCSSIRGCQAVAVDNYNGGCMYLNNDLYSSGWTEVATGGSYWNDLGCFNCYPCIHPGGNTQTGSVTTQTDSPSTQTGSPSTQTNPLTITTHWSNFTSTQTIDPPSTISSPTSTPVIIVPELCDTAVPSQSDEVLCGMPANSGGNRLQSAGLSNYVIAPKGSLGNCGKACLERADCISFAYEPLSTACYLFRQGLSDLALSLNPQSSMWFYDRFCFTCNQ